MSTLRPQPIADWLKKLGLEQYAQRFVENDINVGILPHLTDQDLKELGVVSLGHRRQLLLSIAELTDVQKLVHPTATGTPIAPHDTAERRQVTVMFSDLVGSTALSARMDPEDLREVISAYQKCVAEAVQRFGGFVAKYMGDGVLVYFGYPQAHEDDAERAVRAGLELLGAVSGLKSSAPLQTRVGISTGLVVVGDLIGSGEAQERGIIGETPNLAARLQGLAEPNSVVIAESTRKLLGNLFELGNVGAKDLRGIVGPVRAWTVLRPSGVESRFEALRTATTPLVGREEEVDLLLRRWKQANRGDGCVVLISGEPGIGKSRIAQTIVERVSGEPHTRLRYFCSPHHQDSALYPSIVQLERAAGFVREDTTEQRLAKLEAALAQGTNDLSDAVPLLADLLSIPTIERYPPLNLAPQKRKEKTLHAQVAQLEGLAARQPVLMVWEDVHWSDPTTRESLDLLIDRVPTLQVLMILTFRPEFTPPWIGRSHVTMLTLNRLPHRQGAEMITYVTGGKALPKEIADQIVERTDGVPLFIEELTKTVIESGIVAEAGDHYAVAGSMAPLAIPTSLHASLLARLDRLAPSRDVVQIGAALGRSFSHELLTAVAGMPQQRIDEALAQLVTAELIFRRGMPPDAEYTFKHALVQDAAYSTLLRGARQQLHARIAATLESRFPEIVAAEPVLLAQHCTEAGLAEKGISYWLKAGKQSIARCAMTEAVAQLRKGLGLLSTIPDGTAHQEQELDLQITLGQALMAAKGYSAPEAGEVFARARQLCEHLNRPQQLGRVLVGQLDFRLVRGELDQAERHAEEICRLGETWNDVMWKCRGSSVSGLICFHRGKFIDARVNYVNSLSLWNPMFRAVTLAPHDPYVTSVMHLSRTLLCLGYIDQARLRRDDALTEASRLSLYARAWALSQSWYGDCALESAQTLLPSVDEVLAISNEQGFALQVGIGKEMRGWCLGKMGYPVEGISLLLQGLTICRAAGVSLLLPFFLTTLAEVYGMAAQPKEGLDCLAEAAKIGETTQDRWAEAEIHRIRGTLLLYMREHAAAEDSFRHALAVARRQSAKFWELRTAINLSRLWRDQSKRNEARELLAPIYGWFTEGFETLLLQDAKALLDELA
jgi:class 3 adenylate cyclase/predicted ATPase